MVKQLICYIFLELRAVCVFPNSKEPPWPKSLTKVNHWIDRRSCAYINIELA